MQVINKNDKWKKELEKLELEDEQKIKRILIMVEKIKQINLMRKENQ